jgi:hypothetical protein
MISSRTRNIRPAPLAAWMHHTSIIYRLSSCSRTSSHMGSVPSPLTRRLPGATCPAVFTLNIS